MLRAGLPLVPPRLRISSSLAPRPLLACRFPMVATQSELIPRAAANAAVEVPSASPFSSSAEDGGLDTPFLRRVPSSVGLGSAQQKRRRRTASESSVSPPVSSPRSSPPLAAATRRTSFRHDVGHAAAETYLITRLTLRLLRYLGVGYRWITKFLALACYAMLLMPGFLQVGYYYFFSSQVRRSIIYGEQPRNRLDLYLPRNSCGSKPVVAFVTGGAWIIGYKAWGALLGKQLAERDIIVACIDYRNFPQGTISDMVKDASQGISFVCNHITNYGGDPNRIYLIGQSAGAHIAACALLDQAIKECGEGENVAWSVSQIKAYIGISGGYNILNLVDHFHGRGLYRSIFLSIMEGEQSLQRFSPEVMIQHPSIRHAASLLPRIILIHGTGDYSIPSEASKTFADALQGAGAQVDLIFYEGKTHTDLFLQARRSFRQERLRSSAVQEPSDIVPEVPFFQRPLHSRLLSLFFPIQFQQLQLLAECLERFPHLRRPLGERRLR